MPRSCIALLIACAACGDNHASAPDGASPDAGLEAPVPPDGPAVAWMGAIGCEELTCMTIPGTHDSGARFDLIADTSKAQELTIAEQLDAGIRYFDIRLKRDNDDLLVFHGGVDQNQTFQQVLDTMRAFQSAYPTEAILMSVKEETTPSHSVNSFEADFLSFINAAPERWVLGANVPSYGAIAGKILLVRRFDATQTPLGIDATAWPDNTTFDITDADAQLHVEDNYIVTDPQLKWTQVTASLTDASAHAERLHLTYTSGYIIQPNGLPSILSVSSVIDPLLLSTVPTLDLGLGIVVMDHVTPELVTTIYNHNPVPL